MSTRADYVHLTNSLFKELGYRVPEELLVEFYRDYPPSVWELAEYDEHRWYRSKLEHHVELADAWDNVVQRLYAQREEAEDKVVQTHQLVSAYECAARTSLVPSSASVFSKREN